MYFVFVLLSILSSLSTIECLPYIRQSGTWWKPTLNDTFQIQLQGKINLTPNVSVFDIDYTTDAAIVAQLKAKGKHVIAYVSGGSWERYRDDNTTFPSSVLGKVMEGWRQEKWLDIRQIDILRPIMLARAKRAKASGFDAIDWDNVDGYSQENNATGFPLTAKDQIRYNLMLVEITHGLNMAVGLKNDLGQVKDLAASYDFAVNEQCQQYRECSPLQLFTKAKKPVIQIEYKGGSDTVCKTARSSKIGSYVLYKNLELTAGGTNCQTGKNITQ